MKCKRVTLKCNKMQRVQLVCDDAASVLNHPTDQRSNILARSELSDQCRTPGGQLCPVLICDWMQRQIKAASLVLDAFTSDLQMWVSGRKKKG